MRSMNEEVVYYVTKTNNSMGIIAVTVKDGITTNVPGHVGTNTPRGSNSYVVGSQDSFSVNIK